MHDLWHVTTAYGRDTMGEVCLLGFTADWEHLLTLPLEEVRERLGVTTPQVHPETRAALA